MKGLQVGSRVICNGRMSGILFNNALGTIRRVQEDERRYSIEFDEKVPDDVGHSLSGILENSRRLYGYNMDYNLVEPYKYHKFNNYIGDKFKGRRVRVIQNGNTFKLVTTSGTVLYTYIPAQGISKITPTKDKTEKLYVELFEQAIEEYNSGKKV